MTPVPWRRPLLDSCVDGHQGGRVSPSSRPVVKRCLAGIPASTCPDTAEQSTYKPQIQPRPSGFAVTRSIRLVWTVEPRLRNPAAFVACWIGQEPHPREATHPRARYQGQLLRGTSISE
jgi:hypothetical protein